MTHAQEIFFDKNKLVIFGVSDINNAIINDDTIFRFTVNYYHYETDENGIFVEFFNKTVGYHICNESDMDPSMMKDLGIKNANCLDDNSFVLEGYWDEETVTFLDIGLIICQNSTNFTCKSPEEIEGFFDSKYFQISAYGVGVKFQDYQNPLIKDYRLIYELVDTQIYKELNVFFKEVEVLTEDGFLFNTKNVLQDFTFDKNTIEYKFKPQDSNLVCDINLYASHDKVQHTRRYQTISEILASLSGTANFFMFFCFFVTNLKNYLNSMTIIMNELYTYPNFNQNQVTKKRINENLKEKNSKSFPNPPEIYRNESFGKNKVSKDGIQERNVGDNDLIMNLSYEESKSFKKSTRKKEIPIIFNCKSEIIPEKTNNPTKKVTLIPAKKLDNDSFILMHYSKENIKKHHFPIFNKDQYMFAEDFSSPFTSANQNKSAEEYNGKSSLKAKKIKFRVGFFEYIKYWLKKMCFLGKTRKEKWIEKSDLIFRKELDIISILAKLKEFEKLKLILLNEDQLALFDSLSKPMLDLKEHKIFQKCENQPSMKMLKLLKNSQSARKNKEILLKSFRNLQKKHQKNYEDEINKRLINLLE